MFLAKKFMPHPNVTAMDNLVTGFNFVLILNTYVYGFKEISNLKVENDPITYAEGGVNDHQLIVRQPYVGSEMTLSCRRGYIIRGADGLAGKGVRAAAAKISNQAARRAAMIAANVMSPQTTLEEGPALGFINVYNRVRELIASFSFLSLGVKSWQFSDLDATNGSEIMLESFELIHTGLTRIPVKSGFFDNLADTVNSAVATVEDMKRLAEKQKEIEQRRKAAQEMEDEKAKLKELTEKRTKLIRENEEKLREERREENKKLLDEALANVDNEVKEKEAKQAEKDAENKKMQEAKEKQSELNSARSKATKEKEEKEKEDKKKEEEKRLDEALKNVDNEVKEKEAKQAEKDAEKEKAEAEKEEQKKINEERAKKNEENRKQREEQNSEN